MAVRSAMGMVSCRKRSQHAAVHVYAVSVQGELTGWKTYLSEAVSFLFLFPSGDRFSFCESM